MADDVTGLSIHYSRAVHSFDDINTLSVYSERVRVVRFFDHLTQSTREAGIRGVYTVVRNTTDDRTYALLQNVAGLSFDAR